MSGQASALFARWRRDGSAAFERKDWPRLVHVDDLALDALIGTALFMARARLWDSAWHGRGISRDSRYCSKQAMGGRFRSILPSDVRYVVRAVVRRLAVAALC